MRSPRYFVTVFWLLGMMPAAMAQSAPKAQYSPARFAQQLRPMHCGRRVRHAD